MTALDAFLYGMPFVLMAGAGVTLWFAKRAARDIRSRAGLKPPAARRTYSSLASRRIVKRAPVTTEEQPQRLWH